MKEGLLRQYERWECLGDGYPQAWHRSMRGFPAIKDLIREQAGHRCQRCGHPYVKGESPLEGGQSWSTCDESCRHPRKRQDMRWRVVGRRKWLPGIPTLADLEALEEAGQVPEYQARARILTVHHLDEDKANCRWWNLAALCQRCHLRMQRAVVMDRPWHFEHSDWFKPYAAGFYAWKYLGKDLTREETMARLEELLSLEHRFTQEAIF